MSRRAAGDLLAKACVAALWTLLCMNLFADFRQTGRLTSLLFLISESLVVVFTVIRRRPAAVDWSPAATVLTGVSVIGPPLFRASAVGSLLPDAVTAVFSALGMAVVIVGKLSLGRSFGLVPANRGVVIQGPYGLVRHPIYLGYLISHTAFVLANPTVVNAFLFLASDLALVARALVEERLLAGDVSYQDYCRRVSWHLVPGLF
jgi:protein-S-isoprenylcysteine O-methyltransferase Ste14